MALEVVQMEILRAPRQGGGVTPHPRCEIYVDLIVGDLSGAGSVHGQIVDLFRVFATYDQGKANFGYAEVNSDNRLKSSLSQSEEGARFYELLLRRIPVITVSNDTLGNSMNTKNVKLFPLTDLDSNPLATINSLYVAANSNSSGDNAYLIDKIEYINKIISIKPGLFGVSINANSIIQDWINRRRTSQALRMDHGHGP